MLALRNSNSLLRACLVSLALCAVAVPLAHAADAPVQVEVLVILAKEEAGQIDAKLKQVRALQKPPLNGFKSMKVLSTSVIDISEDKDASVDLPSGGKLHVKLLQRVADGRHKVQVTITRPGKQDTVLTVVASGEPFFVAGQHFEGGTLVIGVRVGGPVTK